MPGLSKNFHLISFPPDDVRGGERGTGQEITILETSRRA